MMRTMTTLTEKEDTAERSTRQKQDKEQEPTEGEKPTSRQGNMHQRRYKWRKQNMPTKTTNREDERKHRRRTRKNDEVTPYGEIYG